MLGRAVIELQWFKKMHLTLHLQICMQYTVLFIYKIEWFIDFTATNKLDNLTCVD